MKTQVIVRTFIDTTYQVGTLKKLLIDGYKVVHSNVIKRGDIAVEYIVEKETKPIAAYCQRCKKDTVHKVHELEDGRIFIVCTICSETGTKEK